MQFHPIADCFPLIDGLDFDALVDDVRTNGVRDPIVLLDGQILDGRNRYRAAQAAGVDCPTRDYVGDDPVGFVVSLNLRRRHLSEGQRAWAAAQIARLALGANQHGGSANLPTQATAATMLNIGERSVRNAAVVRDHGVPELQALVALGAAAPSTAAAVARLPEDEQRDVLKGGERLAEALRQKLELDHMLGEARDNLDADSRALKDWMAIRAHLSWINASISTRTIQPPPSARVRDEVLQLWIPVSQFITTNLENVK